MKDEVFLRFFSQEMRSIAPTDQNSETSVNAICTVPRLLSTAWYSVVYQPQPRALHCEGIQQLDTLQCALSRNLTICALRTRKEKCDCFGRHKQLQEMRESGIAPNVVTFMP